MRLFAVIIPLCIIIAGGFYFLSPSEAEVEKKRHISELKREVQHKEAIVALREANAEAALANMERHLGADKVARKHEANAAKARINYLELTGKITKEEGMRRRAEIERALVNNMPITHGAETVPTLD